MTRILCPRIKSPNFEYIDELGNLRLNLHFTAENKMGNLLKAGHISTLT